MCRIPVQEGGKEVAERTADRELCGLAVMKLRKREGLEEIDLGSLLMLDRGSVHEIEAGERLPDEIEALMLGNFFHVYPDKLIKGEIEAKHTSGELHRLTESLLEKISGINDSLKRVIREKETGIERPEEHVKKNAETVKAVSI